MKTFFDMSKEYWGMTSTNIINDMKYSFIRREIAETNFDQKQLIPYALIFNSQGEILSYQRCGSEKRLLGIHSIGFGGHINDQDKESSLFETLTNGLKRELWEEIGIDVSPNQMELIGMINEERSEVGHCHTGIVFQITLPINTKCHFNTEIGIPSWISSNEIDRYRFELWSHLALQLIAIS